MQDENIVEKDEWLFDEVTGMRKKPSIAVLNRRKLSKYEMDELFMSE